MEGKDMLKAGLAGLTAIGAFIALTELFSKKPVPAVDKSPAKARAPLSCPIIIAPATGIITGDDTHRVQGCLREATGPVDLLIHAYGGYCAAVDPIVHALKEYKGGRIHAHIPYFAFSGGTMIALAAKKIIMGEGAVLGPVDPQMAGFAAADLLKLQQLKSADTMDDVTHLMAMTAGKAYEETRKLVATLVRTPEALERLTSGQSSHANPISFAEALALQLPVERGIPEAYYKLLNGRLKRPKLLWEL